MSIIFISKRALHRPRSLRKNPILASRVCIEQKRPYPGNVQYTSTSSKWANQQQVVWVVQGRQSIQAAQLKPQTSLFINIFKVIILSDIKKRNKAMSMQSDEETIDRDSYINIEELVKENRIKDLALSKATNLIELLSVELEVERNHKIEAVRQVEEELRCQFSKELESMKQKIELLERELKRCNAANSTNVKTVRQASLTRTDSSNSLQGKRRRSNNKKYTEMNSQDSNNQAKQTKFQMGLLEDHMINFEEWKETIIDNLNVLVSEDYEELKELLSKMEERYTELEDVFDEPINPIIIEWFQDLQVENAEMKAIINSQQKLMNEMKVHMQELEDVYNHALFKLSSTAKYPEERYSCINLSDTVLEIKLSLSQRKLHWSKRLATFEDENAELKNILDSIIHLVQEERIGKF